MSLIVASSVAAPATAAPPRIPSSAATQSVTLAELIEQAYTDDYVNARQQYKSSHAQYTARVKAAAPSYFDHFCAAAFQDLSFYTSAANQATCCAPPTCTHGPHKRGWHALNHQLRLSARERQRTSPARPRATGADVIALLVAQEAAEYADLVELERASFERVAQTYYERVYGPVNQLHREEAKARHQLEDEHSHATAALVADIREELWLAEQRLLLRAYGMCPDLLPHRSRLEALMLQASMSQAYDAAHVLESRTAVPLWHHTCVIRAETESEEDIEYRRLLLACAVQAHAIQGGYICRDRHTGYLRRTLKPLPTSMEDAVAYGLQHQQLSLVLDEETERMALLEAAEQDRASLLSL